MIGLCPECGEYKELHESCKRGNCDDCGCPASHEPRCIDWDEIDRNRAARSQELVMKQPVDPDFNAKDVLKKYPKIADYGSDHGGARCIAFEKLDGSNVAWRWRRHDNEFNLGWFTGGPVLRSGKALEVSDPIFGRTYDFVDVVAKLVPFLRDLEEAVVFTEYLGSKTFSGEHVAGDAMRSIAIDVWVKGQGFLGPVEFLELCRQYQIPHAPVVYQGNLNAAFVESVRAGDVAVTEGVVCKGGATGKVWACKIKTRAWLAKGGEA